MVPVGEPTFVQVIVNPSVSIELISPAYVLPVDCESNIEAVESSKYPQVSAVIPSSVCNVTLFVCVSKPKNISFELS